MLSVNAIASFWIIVLKSVFDLSQELSLLASSTNECFSFSSLLLFLLFFALPVQEALL